MLYVWWLHFFFLALHHYKQTKFIMSKKTATNPIAKLASISDGETMRTTIASLLNLPTTVSLQAAITMFFMQNSSFTKEYKEFVKHYNNRKVNTNHIKTLRAILNEDDMLQIWYPSLVIENRLGLTEKDMEDIRTALNKGEEVDDSKFKKRKRAGSHVPKYIIVDGQHRFEAFKAEKKEIVFCDLTPLYGDKVKDPEFVKMLVDKFNIGVKSYTRSEIREKRAELNDFLKAIKEEASKINIRIHKDKNMRSEGLAHMKKGYDVKQFYKVISNSWIEKALGDVAAEHVKTSYMSKEGIADEDRKRIRRSIQFSKCFIDGLEGHFPPMTTEAYAWVHHMTNHVTGSSIDVQFFDKLSVYLKNQLTEILGGNKLRVKQDLMDGVTMYKDNSVIEGFLRENYTFTKSKQPVNDKKGFYAYEITGIITPNGKVVSAKALKKAKAEVAMAMAD
jgi:hypothetical protein